MKKFIPRLLAILFLTISIGSCEKDAPPAPAPSIVGKWTPIKTDIKNSSGVTISQPYTENVVGCDKNYTEFVNGGLIKDVEYSKINNVCTPDIDTLLWELTGNNLKFTDGQYVNNFTVETLTQTDLVVKIIETTGGVTTTITLYFSRI